ncbi:unnamed protein product [Vitrella brassicaformis CCMP3155]|uniref:TOG domain-containing protein n=2 Tax=Vitrella brassicaformis TaxID=1169539 RepID=A0A0G4EPI2_VITBC|nr:unnamed protein product [Vitrella brassicaformis CCMP3155]|eukprot:CEL99170.1 unnamed protein product [Vitrella brassicaformis CCMP3155]
MEKKSFDPSLNHDRVKYEIVKCSSEDQDNPVRELLEQTSATRGWCSARFCDYPQELGLKFEGPVQIRQIQFLSHQSKITSKLELYTALPKQDGRNHSYDSVRFHRLGYLAMSANERSDFSARELKSVYVDVVAEYIKIIVHKCHINKYNLTNQVGFVAVNVFGELLGPDMAPFVAGRGPPRQSGRRDIANYPAPPRRGDPQAQAVAMAEELQYDPQTVDKLRLLHAHKNRAIQLEDYDEAKRCKDMIKRLTDVGKALKELEDKKAMAVRNEDFDAAKVIKQEIDRLRSAALTPDGPISPAGPPSPPHASRPDRDMPSSSQTDTPSVPTSHEQMEDHWTRTAAEPSGELPAGEGGETVYSTPYPDRGGRGDDELMGGEGEAGDAMLNVDDRPAYVSPDHLPSGGLPRTPPRGAGGIEGGGFGGMGGGVAEREAAPPPPSFPPDKHPLRGVPNVEELPAPEGISPSFSKEAGPLIDLFGEYLIRCLYSKTWHLREAAVLKLDLDFNAGLFGDFNTRQFLEGLCVVLKRAISDKIAQVFLTSTQLLQSIAIGLFAIQGDEGLKKSDVQPCLDPLLPLLVERLGDANNRCRDAAAISLTSLVKQPTVGGHFVGQYLLRTSKKKQLPAKSIVSRLSLLESLVTECQCIQPMKKDGMTQEALMQAAMGWFNSPHQEVRMACVSLVGAIYTLAGPSEIEKHLKDLRPAQLDAFELEFKRRAEGGGGVAEGVGLPLRRMSLGGGAKRTANGPAAAASEGSGAPAPAPGKGKMSGEDKKATRKPEDMQQDKPSPPQAVADVSGGVDEGPPIDPDDENSDTCQFCGRQDPSFRFGGMDMHLFEECPLLIKCDACQQVVEIATLRDHRLFECEAKNIIDWQECTRCGLAIASAEMEAHQNNEEECRPLVEGCLRCPLCFRDIPVEGTSVSFAWQDHLLQEGCPANPRSM